MQMKEKKKEEFIYIIFIMGKEGFNFIFNRKILQADK